MLFNLGMTYADMDRHQDAIGMLNRCLMVSHPSESHVRKAYALLASSLMQLEQIEKSAEVCETGLKTYPDDPELHFRAGLAAHRLHRLEDAIRAYRKAMASRGERFFSSRDRAITGYKARHNLALIYEEQGRHDVAELQWRKTIEEVPAYRAGWRGLSRIAVSSTATITEEVMADCLAQVPSLQIEGAWRFDVAQARGDFMQAKCDLERGLSDYPKDLDLQRQYCRLLFEHGLDHEAERALQQLCERDPNDGAAHCNLGTLYLRMGRASDAVVTLERSLNVRPQHELTQKQLLLARQALNERASLPDKEFVECA